MDSLYSTHELRLFLDSFSIVYFLRFFLPSFLSWPRPRHRCSTWVPLRVRHLMKCHRCPTDCEVKCRSLPILRILGQPWAISSLHRKKKVFWNFVSPRIIVIDEGHRAGNTGLLNERRNNLIIWLRKNILTLSYRYWSYNIDWMARDQI